MTWILGEGSVGMEATPPILMVVYTGLVLWEVSINWEDVYGRFWPVLLGIDLL